MKKFDFNKVYNKLTEGFDFNEEIKPISSFNTFLEPLYDIDLLKKLNKAAFKKFVKYCLSLVDTPEKMKKALIDFAKFFMYIPEGDLRRYNLILHEYEYYETKDPVSFACDIDINQFIKLKNMLNPTSLNCSKEAMALALLLLCDGMLYCDDFKGLTLVFEAKNIDWRKPVPGEYAELNNYTFSLMSVVLSPETEFDYNFNNDKERNPVINKDLYNMYISYVDLNISEKAYNGELINPYDDYDDDYDW